MSLQFIMGPSGSGKSHYLYQTVIEESEKYPDKQYRQRLQFDCPVGKDRQRYRQCDY